MKTVYVLQTVRYVPDEYKKTKDYSDLVWATFGVFSTLERAKACGNEIKIIGRAVWSQPAELVVYGYRQRFEHIDDETTLLLACRILIMDIDKDECMS